MPPFQSFLDSHRDAVFRFLVAAVGREDAEDCFQETFLAALRAYGSLPPEGNRRAWVMTIARNKAIDSWRAGGRRALPMAELPEPATDVFEAAGPERDVWADVATLPPKQRAAVLLRYAGDLPHRELARALECSEAAARRSLHEGLSKLRERWA